VEARRTDPLSDVAVDAATLALAEITPDLEPGAESILEHYRSGAGDWEALVRALAELPYLLGSTDDDHRAAEFDRSERLFGAGLTEIVRGAFTLDHHVRGAQASLMERSLTPGRPVGAGADPDPGGES